MFVNILSKVYIHLMTRNMKTMQKSGKFSYYLEDLLMHSIIHFNKTIDEYTGNGLYS